MGHNNSQHRSVSRRTVLRNGGAVSVLLGLGLAAIPGPAAAMNKAELIDSIASEADISKANAKRALDAFIDTTTKALKKGNRVALVGFGSFSVSKRAQKAGHNISKNTTMVSFDPCPEFAAALDLIPGEGDVRRNQSCSTGQEADVVIDAERLVREADGDTDREEEEGITDGSFSKADAKKALDAFIDTTTKALKKGDGVALNGFGSFSISKRSARKGRNPQTGKEIKIPAKKVVKFKPGAELSDKIK